MEGYRAGTGEGQVNKAGQGQGMEGNRAGTGQEQDKGQGRAGKEFDAGNTSRKNVTREPKRQRGREQGKNRTGQAHGGERKRASRAQEQVRGTGNSAGTKKSTYHTRDTQHHITPHTTHNTQRNTTRHTAQRNTTHSLNTEPTQHSTTRDT